MTLWKINMCMKRILYCFLGLLSIAAVLGCKKEEKLGAHEANFPHNEPSGRQLNDDYLSFKFVRF